MMTSQRIGKPRSDDPPGLVAGCTGEEKRRIAVSAFFSVKYR
jgi:hypothetical protein